MTANDLESARTALEEQLRANPQDDHARLVYADLLEESGEERLAYAHRYIVTKNLQLYEAIDENEYLGATMRSDIIDAYLDYWELNEDRKRCEVIEGFDEELFVPTFQITGPRGDDEVYVTCKSRGDLTLAKLRRDSLGEYDRLA